MVFIITTFFNRTKSIKFVKKQNNKIDSLAIVGHNPLLSELVKRFTKILLVLPTLGIIQIEFDGNSWEDCMVFRRRIRVKL